MKLEEIKKRAQKHKIDTKKLKAKKDMILAIQVAEGNFPCFGTAVTFCDQFGCCWRDDCLPC